MRIYDYAANGFAEMKPGRASEIGKCKGSVVMLMIQYDGAMNSRKTISAGGVGLRS